MDSNTLDADVLWQADPLASSSELTQIIAQVMVDRQERQHPAKLQFRGCGGSFHFESVSLREGGPTMVTLIDRDQMNELAELLNYLLSKTNPANA